MGTFDLDLGGYVSDGVVVSTGRGKVVVVYRCDEMLYSGLHECSVRCWWCVRWCTNVVEAREQAFFSILKTVNSLCGKKCCRCKGQKPVFEEYTAICVYLKEMMELRPVHTSFAVIRSVS